VTKLEYTFKTDTLFKMLFVEYPNLLKRLVAHLLGIAESGIGQFCITNPEIPPENLGDKFCRLDITMVVDGQLVDLEIQVRDEGDYPERSLYNWAREYSSALAAGQEYGKLPRTVVVSIVAFNMFECAEFHSEFLLLEATRHTQLTDRICMHYFELPKLPKGVSADDEQALWLALFKAETEEDLGQIEKMGVQIMQEAIDAYRHIKATDRFKEIERLRSKARHNEASALGHASRLAAAEAEAKEREKWLGVVADKDAALANKDAALAGKDVALAGKDAEIARLREQLARRA
jgi:predicted transposase/invertase (TIGR01784 family)